MERTRPGWYEYQVEAELVHEFLRHGAQAVAYPSIVASGPERVRAALPRQQPRDERDGELLLIDAGCEYQGYASDITRTFPVNGRFSGPQKAIYELVLAVAARLPRRREAGRRLPRLSQGRGARAGAGLHRPRAVSRARSTKCSRAAATSSSTCTAPATGSAWTCTTPACYQVKGASQKLVPGMVLTVEPGTYIRPGDNVPEEFWDIGVRIEDDVLVTATGTRT